MVTPAPDGISFRGFFSLSWRFTLLSVYLACFFKTAMVPTSTLLSVDAFGWRFSISSRFASHSVRDAALPHVPSNRSPAPLSWFWVMGRCVFPLSPPPPPCSLKPFSWPGTPWPQSSNNGHATQPRLLRFFPPCQLLAFSFLVTVFNTPGFFLSDVPPPDGCLFTAPFISSFPGVWLSFLL